MDGKWINAYNKKGNDQITFPDKKYWAHFMQYMEDTRDIMSDLVKPSYSLTERCVIQLIPHGKDSFYADFIIHTDIEYGNRIAYSIMHGQFQSAEELKELLRKIGKENETYTYLTHQEAVTINAKSMKKEG